MGPIEFRLITFIGAFLTFFGAFVYKAMMFSVYDAADVPKFQAVRDGNRIALVGISILAFMFLWRLWITIRRYKSRPKSAGSEGGSPFQTYR